jgi:tetratricopeptide (TPR) repeat protein
MARRQLARVYLSQGEPETALQLLRQAVDLRPNHLLLHLELGDVYDALGQTDKAVAAYKAGKVGSRALPLAANYLKKAELMAERGSGDVALGYWQRVLDLDPGNLYALYRLWGIYRDLGAEHKAEQYEERLRYFDLESVVIPMDVRLAEYQAQAMIGLIEIGLWEHEKLLNVVSFQVWQFAEDVSGLMTNRVLQILLDQWPEDADLLFYKAELHHRRDEFQQADAVYVQVLDVAPDYAQAYLRLGIVSEEVSKRENDSIIKRLSKAARFYAQYHALTSDDLLGLKRLTETCTVLSKAGVEDEYCGEFVSWQEELESKTNIHRIVADLLDLSMEDIDLGPNLVGNGGFEMWKEGKPKGWIWSGMFSREPFNDALFVGGCESAFALSGECSANTLGFWRGIDLEKSPARAGYWYWDSEDVSKKDPIELTVQTPYVIGFYYRTERVTEESRVASVWLSETDTLWSHDHYLPGTSGAWRRFVAVGWIETKNAMASPLLRSFTSGYVQFDNVQLREIVLADERQFNRYPDTQYYIH